MKYYIYSLVSLVTLMLVIGCGTTSLSKTGDASLDVDMYLDYCQQQATKTLSLIPSDSKSLPRNIAPGSKEWRFVNYKDWTSGFWPGTLWYLYEHSMDKSWEKEADKYSAYLTPLSVTPALDHDLGFQVFNSYGNGYRLTGNEDYVDVILKSADTLATLYNPNVGTILSWPRDVPNMEWPHHNTIIDNLINLELLFWASKNGGSKSLYDIAVSHADVTMKNHFRPDYSSYHVVIYDKDTGKRIKGVTHQGYDDDSMWARGQGWGIYGYTMIYRETGDKKYLDWAEKLANVYLDRLPGDLIPYWDFSTSNMENAPKDASAAAIVASALLELSQLTEDVSLQGIYAQKAENMLEELSTNYLSKDKNSAFLLHATGHKPAGKEIDYSINYADYYYVEALLRLKKLRNNGSLAQS